MAEKKEKEKFSWAKFRCKHCLGPVRKILWCAISAIRGLGEGEGKKK